jgi:hypothetical protein
MLSPALNRLIVPESSDETNLSLKVVSDACVVDGSELFEGSATDVATAADTFGVDSGGTASRLGNRESSPQLLSSRAAQHTATERKPHTKGRSLRIIRMRIVPHSVDYVQNGYRQLCAAVRLFMSLLLLKHFR